MAEQAHRLSLPLIWGFGARRGHRASSISLASKSSNGESIETPTSPTTLSGPRGVARHSMPPMTRHVEHVQRISAASLHAPAPVISRTRPDTPGPDPRNAARISHSVPSYNSATGQGNSQIHPTRRIDRFLQRLNFMRLKKKEGRGRSHRPIILALVAFILTATIYIILAFSLPSFPNFVHIFFIGTLFVEFGFIVRTLLQHAKRTPRLPVSAPSDAPPVGSIIHGARNWEGELEGDSDRPTSGFDIEAIGAAEALKPVPPAYGVYRGSVRIADSDISWVRRVQMTEHRLHDTPDAGQSGAGRPPSYRTEARIEIA